MSRSMKADCNEHDTNKIIQLSEEIGIAVHEEDIVSVKRIGTKGHKRTVDGEEKEVPRILIVSMTEDGKAKIMKNAYKLQKFDQEYYSRREAWHDQG